MAKFKKGERKVGRAKGTPNKTTVAVKAALVEAFTELGGVPALVKWARTDLAEFYRIWSRLLPQEAKVTVDGKVTLEDLVAGVPAKEDG